MPSTWKGHPIDDLRGDATGDYETFLPPTKQQFNLWFTSLQKVLGALGLLWIIPLALDLDFERGTYPPLLPNTPDDTDDPIFQYVVVALVITAGALQSLPKPRNPLVSPSNCAKNYQYIINSIAGFSAKMNTKCSKAFPTLFTNQEATTKPHPLT